jgi:hypothetical protein
MLVDEFVSTEYFMKEYLTRHVVGVSDGSIIDHLGRFGEENLSPWFVDLRFPELFSSLEEKIV